MGIFHHVTGNVLPIKRSTVCITIRIFSATGIIFHVAVSQEIFFLWGKVIIFSSDTRCTSCIQEDLFLFLQWVFIQCVPTVFFLSQEPFFLWKRIVFLWSLGRLRCITFSRQMRGIHNENFLWDVKISLEHGSQVPSDSSGLPDTARKCFST